MKNKFLPIAALVLCLFLFQVPAYLAQRVESYFEFHLKPGPYAAGFKSVNQYDYSRTFYYGYDNLGNPVKENARPMQISIWYPADPEKARNAPRMKFKEYLYLMAHELGFPPLTEKLKKETLEALYYNWGIAPEREKEEDVLTTAVRDAVPASGSFPLVVYGAAMNSVSFENDALCEYLASHGYIVVSSPGMGRFTREMGLGIDDVETQARDMEFLLGYMQRFPRVNREKVAVMGFSRGAMANVLTAMRDSRVDALVCLDSALRDPKHILHESPDHNPDNISMPSLFIISKEIPDALWKKAGLAPPKDRQFKFYEMLKYSDAYLLQFHTLTHYNLASALTRLIVPDPQLSSSREEINRGHSFMCKYVRMFLDAYLKEDAAALAFMARTPAANGIPDNLMTKKSKTRDLPPPRTSAFLHQLKKNGIRSISQHYAQLKKNYPDYQIDKDILLNFGWELCKNRDLDDAEAVFRFIIEIDPKSFYAYYGIGDVYRLRGQIEPAIKAYEKSLELKPIFRGAAKQLEKLKKQKKEKTPTS